MAKNAITNSEVRAYRLCHHSFDGIPVCQAANIMKLSPRRVEQLLASLESKAPQLFPVLTPLQARDYHLYTEEGWPMRDIAYDTSRDIRTVSKSIRAAVIKGMPEPARVRERILRYDKSMDTKIRGVF